MRRILIPLLLTVLHASAVTPLAKTPERLDQYGEIATSYASVADLWNSITPQERIFIYYIYRAGIPGNRIFADQTHRHAVELIDLVVRMLTNKDAIRVQCAHQFDVERFLHEADIYAVYLFANHGHYFSVEFENHKRTPVRLNLDTLTKDNLTSALEATGLSDAAAKLSHLHDSLFNADIEPTVTVDGSIPASACNIYSPDFTEEDFAAIAAEDKTAVNAYFYIDDADGKRKPSVMRYKIGGKYSDELSVAHFWLNKAYEHAKAHPDLFDVHIAQSLAHMLRYLVTGDEEDFKQFSIEWLQTKSRVDYNFGFVEVYQDPKAYRGAFESDATIKVVNMDTLNALLPSLEAQLPFPDAFKRKDLEDGAALPNASVNAKIFATGELGPVPQVAAYCLPNYAEIRATYGSKQIIYQQGKGLGKLLNPELSRRLFIIKEQLAWLDQYDPQGELDNVLWDVQVLLHETLGHGSGRLAQHTFVENDPLQICGTQYAVGDVVDLTSEMEVALLGEYFSAHEELRAEIIALYVSIFHVDTLAAHGFYKEWPNKITREQLIEQAILHMAMAGISRLMRQDPNAPEVVQAHARANNTITNYLLDHGGLEIIQEPLIVDGATHMVLGLRITDLQQAMNAVKDLAIEVQRIKSTADRQALQQLMRSYGVCVRYPEFITILKENRQAVIGDLKEVAEIYPRFVPVTDDEGTIIDIAAEWPESFLDQQLELHRLALSTT